jgi:hypothetical protein
MIILLLPFFGGLACGDVRYAPESGHHHGRDQRRYHGCAASRVAIKVRAMAEHKFKIGQMVFYHPRRGIVPIDAPTNRPFQIIQRLPLTDGEFQYRIRSAFEEHERVASESELRAVQQS